MPIGFLKRAVLMPVKGIDYSKPSTYLDLTNNFPKNIRHVAGETRKREGSTLIGSSAISGTNGVMHMATYPTQDLSMRLIRCSKTKIEKYNSVGLSWDDITGPSSLSGGDDNYFSHAVAENKFICTNYYNLIWTYTDGAAARTGLGGTPGKAKYIEYLNPYLVLGFLESGAGTNYHLQVKWSDTGNIATWTGGNAGGAALAHDSDDLRGLKNINEFCAAYKKNSIYMGRKVDTSDVIKWDLAEVGTGLMNHRCVSEHNGLHYFMSLNDFKIFNGVRSESIGHPVRDYVFPYRNTDKDASHFIMHHKEFEEMWFFVVMFSEGVYPSHIWKYNYRYGFWYMDTCSNYRTATEWYNQYSITIDDLIGTIDAQAGAIDDYLNATNAATYAFGDNLGYSYASDKTTSNDNGSAVESYFSTIDFVGDRIGEYTRFLVLDFWAKGNSVDVSYSTDNGLSWRSIKTVTLTGFWKAYRVYFDIVSENIRFKIQNSAAGQTFWIRQLQPFYVGREEINV